MKHNKLTLEKKTIKGIQEKSENQINAQYKHLIIILSEIQKEWTSHDKTRMLWEKNKANRQAVQTGQEWAQGC